MRSSNAWQHDNLLQTLYSGRCGEDNALHFDYALAQARADVFFSLLFGGRIVCSAGAFFDSAIAIRVFGELFSQANFKTLSEEYEWYPLCLNTDNPAPWRVKDYLISRWLNPEQTFGLFREREKGFEAEWSGRILEMRRAAADCVRDDQYDRLRNVYRPFLVPYEVPRYDYVRSLNDKRPDVSAAQCTQPPGSVLIQPILTEDFASWLRSIVEYLTNRDCFYSMDSGDYENTLTKFSPLSAIKSRTRELPRERVGDYDLFELQEMNHEFENTVGNNPMMGAFHQKGPGIYGHYYALINNWIEAEWHATRHAAYRSRVCLFSSNWEEREVFDFDAESKIHYLLNAHIDDSLRLSQEKFGELDWSLLLGLVSDQRWRSLIWDVRDAKTSDAIVKGCDQMLDMLAGRITDFSFQADKGCLSIMAKSVANVLGRASAALCTSHFQADLSVLMGPRHAHISSSLTEQVAALSVARPIERFIVSGTKWLYRPYIGRELRTVVSPPIYLGNAHLLPTAL